MNHFQDSTPICILSFVLKKGSKGEKTKETFFRALQSIYWFACNVISKEHFVGIE